VTVYAVVGSKSMKETNQEMRYLNVTSPYFATLLYLMALTKEFPGTISVTFCMEAWLRYKIRRKLPKV